jgi:hypothetical protein
MVSAWLLNFYGGAYWPVGIYMMILALITVVSCYFAAETYKDTIDGMD